MQKVLLFFLPFSALGIRGDITLIRTQLLLAQTTSFLKELHTNVKELNGPQTVTSWYRLAQEYDVKKPLPPLTPLTMFKKYLEKYIRIQKKTFDGTFNHGGPSLWLNGKIDLADNVLSLSDTVQPFALKYSAQPGKHIYFSGDLHGDIKALTGALYDLYKRGVIDNDLKIIDGKSTFFIMGDFTDRGQHGIDVIALLVLFALKNSLQVFIIRGNHEDRDQNLQPANQGGGLAMQLISYINNVGESESATEEIFKLITKFYNLLPVVAFVGCNNNYLQCCHGGLEIRYNPQKLLTHKEMFLLENIKELIFPAELDLYQKLGLDIFAQHIVKREDYRTVKGDIQPFDLGFLWNDFTIPADDPTIYKDGRGFKMGPTFAKEIFRRYSTPQAHVKGIIRGHQHNGEMLNHLTKIENGGIYTLLHNTVLTTIGTSQFNGIQTYVELVVENDFNAWHLITHYRPTIDAHARWQTRTGKLVSWTNAQP